MRSLCVAVGCACMLSGPGLACSVEAGTIDLLPGRALPLTCDDGVQNGNETDVDCGGSCAGCGEGKICEEPADCMDGMSCVGTKCRAR